MMPISKAKLPAFYTESVKYEKYFVESTRSTCSIRIPTTDCFSSTHFALFSRNKGKVFTLKARRDLYLPSLEYSPLI
jgi:hypothetical protein